MTEVVNNEEDFLYGQGQKEGEEQAAYPMEQEAPYQPSDSLDGSFTSVKVEEPSIKEGGEPENGNDSEDDEDDDGVQIVLNEDAVNQDQAFPRRPIFSRAQPNQPRPGAPGASPSFKPTPQQIQQQLGQQQPIQVFQSPIVGLPPNFKTAFDIDIEGLDEKPWRKPGADITDYFNYGFNEDTWKMYCQKQVGLRLEQSMQGKIKVYQSDQSEGSVDLLAFAKQDQPQAPKPKPKQPVKKEPTPTKPISASSGDAGKSAPRRQRDADDSVIQVLASGGEEARTPPGPEADLPMSPRDRMDMNDPYAFPYGMPPPMGRYPMPGGPPMRGMPPPPFDRDRGYYREERPRERERGRDDREDERREKERRERERRERDERRDRDERRERERRDEKKDDKREERRDDRSREREDSHGKRKREEEDRSKRSSRH